MAGLSANGDGAPSTTPWDKHWWNVNHRLTDGLLQKQGTNHAMSANMLLMRGQYLTRHGAGRWPDVALG
ncbi:hypothetical protein MY3296_005700 [Beauveria thailandica]